MTRVIGGIIVAIISIFILSMGIIMIEPTLDDAKQSDVLNCKNYVDADDASLSYNSSLETNTSACTVLNSTVAFFALAVIVGIFFGILYGSGGTPLDTREFAV